MIRWSPDIHSEISVNYATPICIKRQAESTQKAEARRKKLHEAHAAKQQAESTQKADARRKKKLRPTQLKQQAESTQEADARRELPRPRQLNGKLSQPRKLMHGERMKLRPR